MIGRCYNQANLCSLAAMKAVIPMASIDTMCPECSGRLQPQIAAIARGGNTGLAIAIGALAAAVAVVGGLYVERQGSQPASLSATPSAQNATRNTVQPGLAIPALAAGPGSAATPAAPASPAAAQVKPTIILALAGSYSVGAEAAPKVASGYLEHAGDTHVTIVRDSPLQSHVVGDRDGVPEEITIDARGTPTGFTALADGTADIAMASRPINVAEREALKTLGEMASNGAEHVIMLGSMSVIVNPTNPVSQLSATQLRQIFNGTIRDWAQLGGRPGPINLYVPAAKSGTSDGFSAIVMGNDQIASTAKQFINLDDLSSVINTDPNGIAFNGTVFVGLNKLVAVSADGLKPLKPNVLTVTTEDYLLSRRLFFYAPPTSPNPNVAGLIKYTLSTAGQTLLEQAGFISLRMRMSNYDVPADAPASFRNLVSNAVRLQTTFRFTPNSATPDTRALDDAHRLANYLATAHIAPARVVLVGFADNRGSVVANTVVSERRAEAIASALETEGISAGYKVGLGGALPVSDNASDRGRDKNRRVEVYVRN